MGSSLNVTDEPHACKTSANAQGLYFQNSGCECELHDKNAFFELKSNFISIHWSFSLFALTELSDMMTKTATMATAKCCQSERGLSNMIFAFGARRKVCGAKERN